ncbi:hypothetical protein MTBPR1_160001 [Candidatus Terasakiella magnetica]|uniref:Uncharacterized protein n=1 Tax=Candidatus Terasakiella magnetica TaxID=1867952 RepID=A0A1C3RFF2_9PROT|nr:hypothetical protein [Candidatus Terasakiella magnetica]SCA56010.1 hypothetical protein MTBPR1_160001 [Candidatus Terasakiella magnetica]
MKFFNVLGTSTTRALGAVDKATDAALTTLGGVNDIAQTVRASTLEARNQAAIDYVANTADLLKQRNVTEEQLAKAIAQLSD